MSLLNIIIYPAPILHHVAKLVGKVDDDIRQLLDDMTETMRAAPGVGLAAPQVNVGQRVVVIDITEGKQLFQMVNPEIIAREGEIEWDEGCLSVPDFRIVMRRSQKVTCRSLDRHGKEQTVNAENLLAVCIQHEIDHLDGKLIIDRVNRLEQDLYLQKLRKGKLGKAKSAL